MKTAALLLLPLPFTAHAGQDYLLHHPLDKPVIEVSMHLRNDGLEKILYTKSHSFPGQMQGSDQISTPHCNGHALLSRQAGVWLAPATCLTVSWKVLPDRPAENTYDASLQRTAQLRGQHWLLFSESTSLLRIEGESGAGTLRTDSGDTLLLGGKQVGKGLWQVPAQQDAPEFYAVGPAPTLTKHFGGLTVSYVADSLAQIQAQGLIDLHAESLQYLIATIFPGRTAEFLEEHLLIIWLGLDARRGSLDGAAGNRSFLANYLVSGTPDAADSGKNTLTALMVTAHEQFHQLTQVARADQPALPGWLNEALAAYYGVTTARKVMPGKAAEEIYLRYVDPARPIKHGLREWARRHEKGDQSAYPNFYTQGATFLSLLDANLKAHGSSLDALLPALLRSPMPADGGLPPWFTKQLCDIGGTEAEDLLLRYIGTPESADAGSPTENP